MKANELMLGDWVYGLYPNGDRYQRPFRISAVDTYPNNRSPRIVTEGGYGFQEEHLEPIHLAPEILEKNGWRYNDAPFVQGWEQYGITIINNRITCGQNVSMKVEFVHELQHALKLCGIEKEITL